MHFKHIEIELDLDIRASNTALQVGGSMIQGYMYKNVSLTLIRGNFRSISITRLSEQIPKASSFLRIFFTIIFYSIHRGMKEQV